MRIEMRSIRPVGRCVALMLCVAALGDVPATETAAPVLTGSDYAEIQGLYGRSLHDVGAADGGSSRGGAAYARSFVADGQLISPSGTRTGSTALADMAVSKRDHRFWITNLLIESVEGGVRGWAYVVESDATGFLEGGLYRDEWTKTKDGWRITTRTYLPGSVWPRFDHVQPQSSNRTATLTPVDYAEIRNLVMQYNVGYDNAGPFDNGALSVQPFAPDAVFERIGAVTLRGPAAIAGQSSNHKPALHHWDSNFLITLLPNGEAESFNYDMQFNVGDSGTPVRVGGAGLLHHRYVKTPDGWRVTFRKYEAVGSTPQINWPGPEFTPFVSMLPADARKPARRSQLSAADHVDLDQLYIRNNIAYDSAADDGARYADTFTPDGVVVRGNTRIAGTAALAAEAKGTPSGPHNWISNIAIQPSKDGATGRVYVLTMKISGEPGVKQSAVTGSAIAEDVLVRTPNGWRFKQRMYRSLK